MGNGQPICLEYLCIALRKERDGSKELEHLGNVDDSDKHKKDQMTWNMHRH